ncbi:hypothetical protein MRB53_015109 [Persea americana]|uniref:Uncharacterized protein n=1 Tax=Persea americana TaxID=3435 RepID=A0ACC2KCX2_PERAE|nr:hypothetical protein MRB53_015109 [Persea americana]|eukprot:TRINITY_DN2472_c3_g2_i3.p1 TRINITY_DN2472_c3_g2~~TRINITY_DN2472_c3_g2_i3.p1  ORF type:complete len:268 (-),score=48.19 TRINITY_DN2472_c3_g2_i3:150-953(-)
MVGHGHGIARPLEVAETVLEVADLAWNAIEHHRHAAADHDSVSLEEEISSLEAENRRLRTQLQENLNLLRGLAQSSALSKDCPPDLYLRLVATVDSPRFLSQLESLHQASRITPNNNFPFKEATEADLHCVEYMVNVDPEEPSWWVWVTEEMVPSNTEEWSGIDNENYVIISEEQVVDGVANFLAQCILSSPKSKDMKPEELQRTVMKTLGNMNKWKKMTKVWEAAKIIYALSTWGIALAGLYRHRAIVKAAAKGISASSKVILKAI